MTVRECYERMEGDYEGVLARLGSEDMVGRFAVKFLKDSSFANLTKALEVGNAEEAFRAAHTLKGICLNLGFDKLYEVSAELTEMLRGASPENAGASRKNVGDSQKNVSASYDKVKKCYEATVDALGRI